jgi:very-short-patch-repair endonuclease
MPRVPPRLTAYARELRATATLAERKLWRLLAQHRPRFTRQHVVGPYILDFACRSAKLAVELDGSQHLDAADYDAVRTAFLEKLGWRVLRFWNSQLADNPEGVAAAIIEEVGVALGRTHPQPLPVSREGSQHGDPI